MPRIDYMAVVLCGVMGCASPSMPPEPDPVRSPVVAAPRRMEPLAKGATYLEGAVEIVDFRLMITQAPYVDVTIKNRTSREIEIEYRFRYFEPHGRELFTDRSVTFARITLGPSEVRILPSESYRGSIDLMGMDIRWPVNREP